MQSRHLLRCLSVLTCVIVLKASRGNGSVPSCLTWRPADSGQTRVNFLLEDAASARSLYLTLWSEVDRRLLSCEVTTDPLVTEEYLSLCDRSETSGREISRMFDISAALVPDAPCELVSSSAPVMARRLRRDGTERRTRRKRAWFFPGTMWCGTGSRAIRYDQLGTFESADRCCREHDHCLHYIPSLTVKYGVFNPNFFTVSYCDCDIRFRQCLLGVNDTVSKMVGYSFFNILKVPCFELKQQKRCSEAYWWGMCKASNRAPIAVFKKPLPFNTTDVASNYWDDTESDNSTSSEWKTVTDSPVINPHQTKGERKCGSNDPSNENIFNHKRKKGKGCKRQKKRRKMPTLAPSQIPSLSRANSTSPSMETSTLHSSKGTTWMSTEKTGGITETTRQNLSTHPTKRSQGGFQVTTTTYPHSISANGSTRLDPQTSTAVTKTTWGYKNITKQSPCCGSTSALRGDSFRPHCKSCREQNTTPHMTTVTAPTTTHNQLTRLTNQTEMLEMTMETPEPYSWNTTDPAMLTTTNVETTASIHEDGKKQKQMESHLLWNNTSQELMEGTKAPNPEQSTALHNMTDSQLLCGRLNCLDGCKYKIPPLEKKYTLHNMESKTAYHCDCTSRLAVQIKSFKQPSILPTLLMDFVSLNCFELTKEKDCRGRKRCAGVFTKANDLLEALENLEEKDTTRVRKSAKERRRRIPVRLSKRCLRLEREADIMAQVS